jgi:hypothetical protein
MGREFRANLLREPAHFLMQRAVAELEVMVADQILDLPDLERHAHADADGADRQEFHDALHA